MKTRTYCVQEYVEREDEFDVNPRSPERPAVSAEGDNDELDVVACEPVDALYYSTDEDSATAPPRLHHLPLEIEPQRPSTPECAPVLASESMLWYVANSVSQLQLLRECCGMDGAAGAIRH